jgi:hypothetical protein
MNSHLKDRVFNIRPDVLDFLKKQKDIPGLKRNKNLLEKGQVTYGQLKRILHDLKGINKFKEPDKYNYYGGDLMRNWGIMILTNERNLINNREEATRIANDIAGLSGDRKNPTIKRHRKNTLSPKISVNDIVKPKSNSEKFTNSSIFSAKSMKLFEQINRMKKLML